MRTWSEIDFLVKCFMNKFGCFAVVVLRNLNADKCSYNPCRVMKAQHGRQIPTFYLLTLLTYFTCQRTRYEFFSFSEFASQRTSCFES